MKRLAALLPLLSACGSPPAAAADERIECALDGAETFERVCTVERSRSSLTVRGPSGTFRRLVAEDGRVAAADGAEAAVVTPAGKGLIEVSIGRDRYRLPVAAP
jgi:hypothetical protein